MNKSAWSGSHGPSQLNNKSVVWLGPNPPLNSGPACIVFRSFSTSRYLGSVQRLGAGGAGWLHSLRFREALMRGLEMMTSHFSSTLTNSVGLISDVLGAWLVGWEVVQQFKGKKLDMASVEADENGYATRIPETKEYQDWECNKYMKMKIGLGFLTLGFALQFVATWISYCMNP